VNFHVNTFPLELDFGQYQCADSQTASTSYGRSGVSAGFSDSYQFASGAVLNTLVRYTPLRQQMPAGQGPADMEISPKDGPAITLTVGIAIQTNWQSARVSAPNEVLGTASPE